MSNWLTRDLAIKIGAVLVAIIIWFQAVNEQNPIVSVDITAVPVAVIDMPSGLMMVELTPRIVTVTVRGRSDRVARLSRSDVSAWVDINGLQAGRQVPVAVQAVVPPGLELAAVRPGTVAVTLEQIVRKQIPVELVIEGLPARDHVRGPTEIRPTDVLVEGPESAVALVATARVILELDGATGDVVRTLPVQLLTEDYEVVFSASSVPSTVDVSIPITRLSPLRRVPLRVELAGEPAEGYMVAAVEVDPVEAGVRGPESVTGAIDQLTVGPVDIDGAEDTVHALVDIPVPSGADRVDPRTVAVTVRIERVAHHSFAAIPVEIRNLDPGLRASVEPATVAVTVFGLEGELADLTPDGVRVEIDADGLGPGEHELEAVLRLPDELSGRVEPGLITIVITGTDDADEE